jgi:hypothetical protein
MRHQALSAIVIVGTVFAYGGADAALCVNKKSGVIALRTACKRRETPADPAQIAELRGPKGEPGNPGDPGPDGEGGTAPAGQPAHHCGPPPCPNGSPHLDGSGSDV